jgi:hypothetical protein
LDNFKVSTGVADGAAAVPGDSAAVAGDAEREGEGDGEAADWATAVDMPDESSTKPLKAASVCRNELGRNPDRTSRRFIKFAAFLRSGFALGKAPPHSLNL